MIPGQDHMGAPTSFTARRPHASNLPNFELPPPPLSGLHQKYQSYSHHNQTQPSATNLTSVGNLLTPPSNSSADGISPTSSGITTGSSQGGVQSFTPTGSGGMWPPPNTGNTPYGFHQQAFSQGRGLFSPSLNSIVRGNNSPTTTEGLPPPPYELNQYSGASMPMSAPSLPAITQQQQMIGHAMMGGQQPVSQASPVSAQDTFARAPPTPTYYNSSQPPSATPTQGTFSYSSGPSPVQQSPISAGGHPRMSPMNGHGQIPPPQHAQQYTRPYTYPLPGPVMSNVSHPNGQLQMVGGMSHGMMPPYNSGHAAQMQQLYGHPQQGNPQNDRPFRCDQCPQSFNRNHDLKRHKRIHLAVKPFPCGHCDKSFSRKDALKRHVLVKGCGKAHATSEVKEIDGSISPVTKSESAERSPVTAA
ncbi:hypothetical protein LTR37_008252 [Vermiconidia calcicola]|uniref:Uncharacterized protein n=1 Tax=Vermiconidia calcicola TaxID=1690605 RepID=A0ACC3NBF7_9PEZI|nr:hypothetical protein LTR37_008252 [Vermiconidia calcicola]